MANSLGKLVVSLGLDAAEFVSGLTKAEFEAQKFKKRLEAGVDTAGRAAAVGVGLITTAALAAAVAIDSLVKEAARFKDLEEITGASAESLASFAVSAKVAGTDMNTVAAASVKLTKNLTGVDDESKAAGAALTALGIPIKEFKALDPAAQFDAVAKALVGFKDGAAKTAVAVALFGKSGAELLPFLKELGSETGRQTILTQRQIELADAYADAQAKSTAQIHLYLQALSTEALPTITAFQNALKETAFALLNVDTAGKELAGTNAVKTFAEEGARSLGVLVEAVISLADGFRKGGIVIGAIAAEIASGSFAAAKAIKEEADADLKRIDARKSFVAVLDEQLARQKKIAVGLALIDKSNEDRNDRLARGKTLSFDGPPKAAGGAAKAERLSDAERFLATLQKQLDKTQELGAVEQALAEIQSGRLKGLTPAIEKEILFVAERIDQEKALKNELQESAKAQEEMARAQAAAAKERQRSVDSAFNEAEAIKEGNDALREEIAVILGGTDARRALEAAHIASAIAKKEDALATELLNNGEGDRAAFIRAEIDLLKERNGILLDRAIAENIRLETEAMKAFADSLANEVGSALADVILGTKSFKDAFADLTKSITRNLTEIASQSLAKSLFGGTSGGPDIFSLLGSLFGGGAGAGAGAFGSILGGFAGGTNFATGGSAIVGERGPELVNLPRGAQVIPNEVLMQRRDARNITVNQSFNVMPGASTASARQTASMARDKIMQVSRDR